MLTLPEIRRYYIGNYRREEVLQILFYLEELGYTISGEKINSKGVRTLYFYFDTEVKERLLKELEKRNCKKTRVHYKVPHYIKFYTIYQYDRDKFRNLMKEWLKSEEGINRTYETLKKKQEEILEMCWVRDENGKKIRDVDEQHIYRYKTLHRILECVAYYLMNVYGINTLEKCKSLFLQENIMVYCSKDGGKPMAEIVDTIMDDVKTRIITHVYLLKGLKQGLSVKEAVNRASSGLAGFIACHNKSVLI